MKKNDKIKDKESVKKSSSLVKKKEVSLEKQKKVIPAIKKKKSSTKIALKKQDEEKNESSISLDDLASIEKKKMKHQKISFKKKKLLIICLIAIIFLLLLVSYLFFFPFQLSYKTKGELTTKTGTLSFEVNINSNKPISEVYYAIDPADENNLNYYNSVDKEGFLFHSKIDFEKISIPVGTRNLVIYVKSFLGTHEIISIPVEYTIGYTSPLSLQDIVESPIGDDALIIDDQLLITFEDNCSEERAKELIAKYQGDVVGEIYFLKQYQVHFETNDLESIKENLEAEDGIVNISYNYFDDVVTSYNKVGSVIGEELHLTKNYYKSALGIEDAIALIELPHMINIGMIDSPIDYRHEDLNINKNNMFIPSMQDSDFDNIDNILEYYDTYNHEDDDTYSDDSWDADCKYLSFRSHGTHVAGIMAGLRDGEGVDGINDYVNLYYASMWTYYKKSDVIDQLTDDKKTLLTHLRLKSGG